MDYLNGQTNSDKSMATAFKNFQNMFTKIELSKLKSGNWCFNDIGYETTSSSLSILNETQKLDYIIKGNKMFFYDSYSRLALTNEFLRQSTLKCNGIIMKDWNDTDKTPMYVGTLTADEIVYAGGEN